MGSDLYLIPSDMDYDLWKAVDGLKWDNSDFNQNTPIVVEPITVQNLPVVDNTSFTTLSVGHTCSFCYDRIFREKPENYRKIIGTGKLY